MFKPRLIPPNCIHMDFIHNGRYLKYSFTSMVISLTGLNPVFVTQNDLYFQTGRVELFKIDIKEHWKWWPLLVRSLIQIMKLLMKCFCWQISPSTCRFQFNVSHQVGEKILPNVLDKINAWEKQNWWKVSIDAF